ncbi:unnamed protein product, partial [Discosporangium mesarthrocarpum]
MPHPTLTIQDGYSSLHTAVLKGQLEATKHLVMRGANINATDLDGWTPLHVAADMSNTDLITALIDLGANVDAKDRRGRLPAQVSWGTRGMGEV